MGKISSSDYAQLCPMDFFSTLIFHNENRVCKKRAIELNVAYLEVNLLTEFGQAFDRQQCDNVYAYFLATMLYNSGSGNILSGIR